MSLDKRCGFPKPTGKLLIIHSVLWFVLWPIDAYRELRYRVYWFITKGEEQRKNKGPKETSKEKKTKDGLYDYYDINHDTVSYPLA